MSKRLRYRIGRQTLDPDEFLHYTLDDPSTLADEPTLTEPTPGVAYEDRIAALEVCLARYESVIFEKLELQESAISNIGKMMIGVIERVTEMEQSSESVSPDIISGIRNEVQLLRDQTDAANKQLKGLSERLGRHVKNYAQTQRRMRASLNEVKSGVAAKFKDVERWFFSQKN